MRIVLFASGEFCLPTLTALTQPPHAQRHEIAAVVTQPDKPAGRGKKNKPTPVRSHAMQLGLETMTTPNVNDDAMIARLSSVGADLGLVIAFGQKINQPVRSLFRHRCVNLHASLLPKYRGAAPFQWAIINGESRTGVTIFELVDRMDAGPIYVMRETDILPNERAADLHDRLAIIGADAVVETLDLLEKNPEFEPAPQDDAQATRAPKLSKADGLIRFDLPGDQLVNRINGLWSWPGAACDYVPQSGSPIRVTLAHARVAQPYKPNAGEDSISAATVREQLSPGTFDEALRVVTSRGAIEILEIQPQGKRVMTFRDFVNGRHVQPGDRLAPIEFNP